MNHAGRAALFLTTAMLLLSPAAIPAIYDGDDRRSIVDNDDPRIDALSDAVGAASVCNHTLSAVLTKREDDPADYVVLPAHSFFDRRGKPVLGKDGKPCTIEELAQAEYYPNLKYLYLGADRDFAMRALPVAWPPINLETGREWGTRGEDVLIFRIDRPAQGYLSDDIMPSGRKRGHLRYFLYDPKAVEMSRSRRQARRHIVRAGQPEAVGTAVPNHRHRGQIRRQHGLRHQRCVVHGQRLAIAGRTRWRNGHPRACGDGAWQGRGAASGDRHVHGGFRQGYEELEPEHPRHHVRRKIWPRRDPRRVGAKGDPSGDGTGRPA